MISEIVGIAKLLMDGTTFVRTLFKERKAEAAAVFNPIALLELRANLKVLRVTASDLASKSRTDPHDAWAAFRKDLRDVLGTLENVNLNTIEVYYPQLGQLMEELYRGDSAAVSAFGDLSNSGHVDHNTNKALMNFASQLNGSDDPVDESLIETSGNVKEMIVLSNEIRHPGIDLLFEGYPKPPVPRRSPAVRDALENLAKVLARCERAIATIVKENWTPKDLANFKVP